MILHPATSSRIVRAVRRSALAITRVQRHTRALADAKRTGTLCDIRHAEALLTRALSDFDAAQRAMKFPWEV